MIDPILGLPFGTVLLLVGALEVYIALIGFFGEAAPSLKLAAIAWVATTFLVYRWGLWSIGWQRPCGCMGNLTDVFHLSPKAADNIIKGLLAYLLTGSYILLFSQWRAARFAGKSAALARLAFLLSAAGFASIGASPLKANDFKASGEVQSLVIVNSQTTLVQRATFTVTRIGTNWSILNGYSGGNIKSYNALVDGTPYLSTLVSADGSTSGLVFENPQFQLEGATAFTRCVFGAFLVSQEARHHLTNVPVPFLQPRDPALYAYDWTVQWAKEPPGLAAHILFTLDKDWPHSTDHTAIEYFYGSRFSRSKKSPSSLVKDFKRAQSEAAPEYSVLAWTNFAGSSYPAMATFTCLALDETLSVFKNLAVIQLTSIEPPGDYRLLPPLAPNSMVHHVIGGTAYLYKATSGAWLTSHEAKRVGLARPLATTPLRATAGPSVSRYIILVLLTFPIVFWLSKKLRGRRRTNTA